MEHRATTASRDHQGWCCRPWDELSRDEVHAILAVRAAVFVVEQRCVYLDVDGLDPAALHLWRPGEAAPIAAYARLLPPGVAGATVVIGRVLTAPAARGTGLGRELMARAVEECARRWPGPIELAAQAHLEGFYASLGFTAISPIYDDDGIPHRRMRSGGAGVAP